MAKKKRLSIVGSLEETVSDMANAVSVAATGSDIRILELAAEDESNPRPPRKTMVKKSAAKKRKAAPKKPNKVVKGNRAKKRRKR